MIIFSFCLLLTNAADWFYHQTANQIENEKKIIIRSMVYGRLTNKQTNKRHTTNKAGENHTHKFTSNNNLVQIKKSNE